MLIWGEVHYLEVFALGMPSPRLPTSYYRDQVFGGWHHVSIKLAQSAIEGCVTWSNNVQFTKIFLLYFDLVMSINASCFLCMVFF